MPFQQRRIDQVGSLYGRGIEPRSVAARNGVRDRIGLELSLQSSIAADMVDEYDAGKLTVNLVVEIPRNEPAGIEDSDRRLRHSSRTGQLSDERKDQMGRRVETVDRAMIRCVVQVWLDCDLFAGLVSDGATIMGASEIVEDGAPCLGIALLICKTADGAGDHAVNHSLVVVGVRPPGTCPLPGHSCRIVSPGDSAGNYAAGNTSGESVDPNKEERMLLAAAIERAKCRRVIFICGYSFSINHVFRDAI